MICECGCGRTVSVSKQTDTKRGFVKGQPMRFIPGHNQKRSRTKGYYTVYRPDHPKASASGDVPEHVLVAERALGRFMPAGSQIHHVDENTLNNANGNLVICQDVAYHKLLHVRTRVVRAGGDPNTQRICSLCRQLRPLTAFNRRTANVSTGLQSGCAACMEQRRRLRRTA